MAELIDIPQEVLLGWADSLDFGIGSLSRAAVVWMPHAPAVEIGTLKEQGRFDLLPGKVALSSDSFDACGCAFVEDGARCGKSWGAHTARFRLFAELNQDCTKQEFMLAIIEHDLFGFIEEFEELELVGPFTITDKEDVLLEE